MVFAGMDRLQRCAQQEHVAEAHHERAPSEHTNQSLSKRNPPRAWGLVSPETERSGAGKMTASLAVLFMGKPPPSCSP